MKSTNVFGVRSIAGAHATSVVTSVCLLKFKMAWGDVLPVFQNFRWQRKERHLTNCAGRESLEGAGNWWEWMRHQVSHRNQTSRFSCWVRFSARIPDLLF